MKNVSISIALILSVLGLGILAGTYWLGMLLTQNDVLLALCLAIGLFVVGLVASLLAIHAKRMRPDFRKWRWIEFVSLAVMLAVAFYMFLDGSVVGFNFMFESNNLKTKAVADVEALSAQVDDFENNETYALDRTVNGLESLYRSHAVNYSNASPEVIDFVRYEVMNSLESVNTFSTYKIEEYKERMTLLIDNLSTSEVGTRGDEVEDTLSTFVRVVDEWSPTEIASFATDFVVAAQNVSVTLQSLTANLDFPIIKAQDEMFVLVRPERASYPPVPSTFGESFSSIFSFNNLTSLLLSAVCVLLFLCNYFLSYRSISLGVGKSVKISDKHGIPLC